MLSRIAGSERSVVADSTQMGQNPVLAFLLSCSCLGNKIVQQQKSTKGNGKGWVERDFPGAIAKGEERGGRILVHVPE